MVDEFHFQLLALLAARGIHRRGSRKSAHVQPITAQRAIRSFAQLDSVNVIVLDHGAGKAILHKQRRVIRTRHDKSFAVHNGHVRIIKPAPQPDALHLGGNALSFFHFHRVAIHRLRSHRTGHRAVERQLLRPFARLGRHFGHHRKRPHEKCAQLRDATARADARFVLAERATGIGLDKRLHKAIILLRDFHQLHARMIKENILRVREALATENDLRLRANLHAARREITQARIHRRRVAD